MFTWLKRTSEKAQRSNVERTLALLISAAAEADAEILSAGAASSVLMTRIVSMQKSLLADLIGPVPLAKLREEYLHSLLADSRLSEGIKMAVQHVFDWAAKSEHPRTMQLVDAVPLDGRRSLRGARSLQRMAYPGGEVFSRTRSRQGQVSRCDGKMRCRLCACGCGCGCRAHGRSALRLCVAGSGNWSGDCYWRGGGGSRHPRGDQCL
jgi:hypothetical protein